MALSYLPVLFFVRIKKKKKKNFCYLIKSTVIIIKHINISKLIDFQINVDWKIVVTKKMRVFFFDK